MLEDWALGLPALHVFGYFLAFLAAFLEALPAIGLFIPGQTIVVVAGFLAHEGVIQFWLVATLACLGGILGDCVGYWAGRRFGTTVIQHPAFLDEVNELLRIHPIKTLVFGRFNSITRAFAPFVAGANHVRFSRFMIANVIGGVLWGLCWATLGYVFGASYELASKTLEWAVVIFIVALTIGYFMYRAWRKRVKRVAIARASARETAHAIRERSRQQKKHKELFRTRK